MRISPVDGYDASHIRLRVSKPEPYNGDERELTGERLRRLRMARGLTLRTVAIRLGLSTGSTVHYWETGENHPRFDYIDSLARMYGCSIAYLVTGRESGR